MPRGPRVLILPALLIIAIALSACEPVVPANPMPALPAEQSATTIAPGPTTTTVVPTPPAPTTTAVPVTAVPAPASGVGQPAIPESGVLTGAYVQSRPSYVKADEQAVWRQRQEAAGRNYDIAHMFYAFDKPFPTWREPWQISQGRTPMVTWGAADTAKIIAGDYDAMIRERARGLKALGAPVFLRWMAEMDGNAKAPLAGSPQRFIAAWNHITELVRSEGADNVATVWCPNSWTYDANAAAASQWYPGPATVDWVCADGYNWAPVQANAPWTSFHDVFVNFYDWAVTTGKPIMIGEFGVIERNPGEKAAWIRDIGTALKTSFPAVKALVYFDALRPETGIDWRLDATTASYDAWNTLMRDPYMNPNAR